MGIFKNLAGIKAFENSKYFREGSYLVEITNVKSISGHKGDSLVIETRVLGARSDDPDAPDVGEIAAQVWNVTGDKREIGLATWKGFLEVALDFESYEMDPSAMSDEDWENISIEVTDNGALNGSRMTVQVWNKTTKAGNPFTQHRWLRHATAEDFKTFGVAE